MDHAVQGFPPHHRPDSVRSQKKRADLLSRCIDAPHADDLPSAGSSACCSGWPVWPRRSLESVLPAWLAQTVVLGSPLARPRLRRLRHPPVPRRRRLSPGAHRASAGSPSAANGRPACRSAWTTRSSWSSTTTPRGRLPLIVRDDVPPGFRAEPASSSTRSFRPSARPRLAVSPAADAARQLLVRRRVGALSRAAGPGVLSIAVCPPARRCRSIPTCWKCAATRRWCGPRWSGPAAIGPSGCPAPAASSAITATTRPTTTYRHVSWKATARRNKPITAVFESEHSQDIIFCLDVGRMMAARVGTLTKLDHAINAVLMLTHVSQTFQDNLGLLVFSHTRPSVFAAGQGPVAARPLPAGALLRQAGVLLRQLPRGVQHPDRPAPQARADDGVHRPAGRHGVEGVSGGGGAAAALPPAADAGRGRRAVAASGRRISRATPNSCTMCWWRATCWPAGRRCCAAWNGRACWCSTPCRRS